MKIELKKDAKNDIEKKNFQANEQCSIWENYGKCEKT